MTDNNETKKSGLQRLRDLAPELRSSTDRLKRHNDQLAAQQRQLTERQSQPKLSAWGSAVSKLRGTNNA